MLVCSSQWVVTYVYVERAAPGAPVYLAPKWWNNWRQRFFSFLTTVLVTKNSKKNWNIQIILIIQLKARSCILLTCLVVDHYSVLRCTTIITCYVTYSRIAATRASHPPFTDGCNLPTRAEGFVSTVVLPVYCQSAALYRPTPSPRHPTHKHETNTPIVSSFCRCFAIACCMLIHIICNYGRQIKDIDNLTVYSRRLCMSHLNWWFCYGP